MRRRGSRGWRHLVERDWRGAWRPRGSRVLRGQRELPPGCLGNPHLLQERRASCHHLLGRPLPRLPCPSPQLGCACRWGALGQKAGRAEGIKDSPACWGAQGARQPPRRDLGVPAERAPQGEQPLPGSTGPPAYVVLLDPGLERGSRVLRTGAGASSCGAALVGCSWGGCVPHRQVLGGHQTPPGPCWPPHRGNGGQQGAGGPVDWVASLRIPVLTPPRGHPWRWKSPRFGEVFGVLASGP